MAKQYRFSHIPLDALMRVHGMLYKQTEKYPIEPGDLVLDLGDFTTGYCEAILPNNNIVVKDGCVAELSVPMSRCRVLVPSIHKFSEC